MRFALTVAASLLFVGGVRAEDAKPPDILDLQKQITDLKLEVAQLNIEKFIQDQYTPVAFGVPETLSSIQEADVFCRNVERFEGAVSFRALPSAGTLIVCSNRKPLKP